MYSRHIYSNGLTDTIKQTDKERQTNEYSDRQIDMYLKINRHINSNRFTQINKKNIQLDRQT